MYIMMYLYVQLKSFSGSLCLKSCSTVVVKMSLSCSLPCTTFSVCPTFNPPDISAHLLFLPLQDHNLPERVANLVTSVPFLVLGVRALFRPAPGGSRAYGTSLIGVGAASM